MADIDQPPAGCPLTPAEYVVLRELAEGATCVQIAKRQERSPATIRNHASSIFRRLKVTTSAQAVLQAYEAGWLPHPSFEAQIANVQESARIAAIKVLAAYTRALMIAVRQRNERELSASQRAHLDAFDDFLFAHGDEERLDARARLTASVDQVLAEAGVSAPARDDGMHDLVEVMLRAISERELHE